MAEQLRMFRMTQQEVEIKARQVVDCRRELHALGAQLKEAQLRLRESSEATQVKEIKDQIKSTRETADRLLADLDAESVPT